MSNFSSLSKTTSHAIDQWLKKFPADQKQSAVIFALKTVQAENNGFLTKELMDLVAEYLGMSSIAVYEVASFYSFFYVATGDSSELAVGRYQLNVCTNISCMLRGSETIMDHLKKRLGIDCGQATPDKQFSLKSVECLAACQGAPVMQLNGQYQTHLTPEKIDKLLEEIKQSYKDGVETSE